MKHSITAVSLFTAMGLLAARQEPTPTVAKADPPAVRFSPNALAVAGASGDVLAISVSSDGKRIASIGGTFNPDTGFVNVIETGSKKELLSLRLPRLYNSVAITPNGKYLAFTGRLGDVKLMEVDTGKTLFTRRLNSTAKLAISPDGRALAAVTESKLVQMWDIPSGEEAGKFSGATLPLRSVAFSPDGKKLAAGYGNQGKKGDGNLGGILVWNVATNGLLHKLESETPAPVHTLAFSPDSARIAGLSLVRQIRIWDLASGKILLTTLPPPQVLGLSYTPDGKALATATGDNSILFLGLTSGEELGSIKGQPGDCRSLAFLGDGKKIVTGGSAQTLKLWDAETKKEIETLRQLERTEDMPIPLAMAAAGDGSLIALTTEDKGIIVRDGLTGAVKANFKDHEDAVTCVAFSPDQKTLASGSADKTIKLWDVAAGKERATLKGHTNWIYALAFSQDGKTLLSGAYDKTIRLWDVENAKELGSIEAHRGSVRAVAISPDGKMIASGGSDRTVKVWNAADRELKFAVKGHEGSIRSLSFSSDGKILASCGEDGNVKLWNTATGKQFVATKKEHPEEATVVVFVGERTVLSGGADGAIFQWDAATGQMFGALPGHAGPVSGIALVKNGAEFISTGTDRAIRRYRRDSPGPVLFKGHTGVVQYAAFSPDGKRFVSCGEWPEGDRTVRIWDVEKGTEILKIDHPGQAPMAIFSPNGRFIASTSDDSNIYLWDAKTGEKVRTFKGHSEVVMGIAFNAEGTQLLSGGSDSTARVWDVETGRELQKFTGHSGSMVKRVAFHPDGKHALTAGRDNFVRMWSIDNANEVQKFKSSGKWADSLAVTRDGKYLAVAGTFENGREVYIYEIESGKKLIECIGHTEGLTHVSFSADGKRLLSSSYDGTARLWDRETGRELYRWPAYGEFLWSAEFSPDNKWVLTGGGGGNQNGKWVKGTDHAVRLWRMPDERMLEEFALEN